MKNKKIQGTFNKKMNKKELKQLEELLIQIGLKIAKRGEGALFVIGETKYKPLLEDAKGKTAAQFHGFTDMNEVEAELQSDKEGAFREANKYKERAISSITDLNNITKLFKDTYKIK